MHCELLTLAARNLLAFEFLIHASTASETEAYYVVRFRRKNDNIIQYNYITHRGHDEAMEAGGRELQPRPAHYVV